MHSIIPGRATLRVMLWPHHEMPASHRRPDQPLIAENGQRTLRGPLGHLVLLAECLDRGNPAGEVAALDLPAQHGCKLGVKRLLRVAVEVHASNPRNPRVYLGFRRYLWVPIGTYAMVLSNVERGAR